MTSDRRGLGARLSTFSTVLFDLDGVLVDTHDVEIAVIKELVLLASGRAPRVSGEDLAGLKMSLAIERACSSVGLSSPSWGLKWVRDQVERRIRDESLPVPYARELAEFWQTTPKFVVSNSPQEMIQDRISRARLEPYFPRPHISGYDLEIWKPDPRIYAHALRALNLNSATTLAIEDSHAGVAAAVGAGLSVIWLYREHDPENHWPESSVWRVGCLSEVLGILTSS